MKGLIVSQIRITGNLEKDQQLLIYGIGALIGLIVVAMITIVVVVLVRRGRAARAAAMAVPVSVPETVLPQENGFKPAKPAIAEQLPVQEPEKAPVKEEKTEPEPEKVTEPATTSEPVKAIPPKAKPSDPVALVAPDAPDTVTSPLPETPEKKYDFNAYKEELAGQDPTDKMEEIRRRLEEIKRQRQAAPAPVLLQTEAKLPVAEPAKAVEPDPVIPDEEPTTEEEMDETRPVNEVPDSETVSITQIPPVERLEPVAEPEPTPEPEAKEEAAKETPVQPEPIAKTKPEPEEEAAKEIPVQAGPIAETEPEPKEETTKEIPVQAEPIAETKPEPEEEAEEEVSREEIRSEGEVYYTVPDEPVMELQRDPQPQSGPVTVTPAQNGDFPNGKFLPMKKLTFAEWVELFK